MAFLWLLSCFTLLGVTFGDGTPDMYPELSIITRIPDEEDVSPTVLPWHVSLVRPPGTILCGGSMINENWVITTAHCNLRTSDLVVLHDQHSSEDDIQTLMIAQIFLHPQFNPSTHFADIALLKLASSAKFHCTVFPVFLPNVDVKFHLKTWCKIMGWGLTQPSGSRRMDRLQQASVPLLSYDRCRRSWGTKFTSDMICAGANGLCSNKADYGGSLVCRANGVWNLVGIVVSANDTCPSSQPMLAIYFPIYKPWVEYIMTYN